jgi:hypothetical protein
MKVLVKTKEELIKAGWIENKRSIYSRLYAVGFGGRQYYNHRRAAYPNRLSLSSITQFLGQHAEVVNIFRNKELKITFVKLKTGPKNHYFREKFIIIDVKHVTGLKINEWKKANVLKKTKAKDLTVTQDRSKFKIGWTKFNKKEITVLHKELGELLK